MQGQPVCFLYVLPWEGGTNAMNGDGLKSTWPSVLLCFISLKIPTSCHSRGSLRREQRLFSLSPVFSWHLVNSFQTAPGDGRWNQPLWRAVVQRSCGISMGCTTVHTIPCPLPTTAAHLAWAGVEGPVSAPRLQKSWTGSIKVGKHCCRTPQWCYPLQGPSRGLVDIRSDQQGFQHSNVRSAFSEQGGSPSAPSLSQRHKFSTQKGNSAAVTRISNCNSQPQALLKDGWQKRCSLQSFAVCLQELSPAYLSMTADVKSLRNNTQLTPAFRECQNQPTTSAQQWGNTECVQSLFSF